MGFAFIGGMNTDETTEALARNRGQLAKYTNYVYLMQKGQRVENLTIAGALLTISGLRACIKNLQTLRYEESC